MKHSYRIRTIFIIPILLFFITACDDDDSSSNSSTGTHQFAITNLVGDSQYLGTFENLEPSEYTNSDAYELISGIVSYRYDNMILVAEGFYGNKIYKYERNASDGSLTYIGALSMASGSMPGEISFLDETTAYVSLHGLGKIAVINPTTLTKTDEIDLTGYAVGDNNPDPGANIIRGNYMYVALNQYITSYSAYDSAYVAIINITTNEVEKVITDVRATAIGPYLHSTAFMDEDENIYFYSSGVWGYQDGAEDGFLRIKAGETEWDPDYYFSIEDTYLPDVTDNQGSYAVCLQYGGDDIVYTSIQIPAYQTGTDPDYVNDRDFQPFKLDLSQKTAEKIDLPLTAGWAAKCVSKTDDLIVFGLSTDDGQGLYTYDPTTGESSSSPVVSTQGIPTSVMYFGE
ncbi:conserved hypothetical lipoprotein [Chloroherpeton thalassium ATCC 35110]|uniref:Conserved hypothetical lipoprotein n=1 Tax=Chloroherpeton thalassium (strain ATCC 35110 / GB-78) TaxID=517418 RepID=B3QXT7_CHLT3|nr:hypothetical protein [Chloroherpeton thalassium]ACF13465.1 conserved hypothetical lipoprotein [Chloroherpeton thalassium ATCC 35110]